MSGFCFTLKPKPFFFLQIGFTECNNWDVLGVQRIAEKFGFQYAEWLEVKSSYHIVIVSKLPIERQGGFKGSRKRAL